MVWSDLDFSFKMGEHDQIYSICGTLSIYLLMRKMRVSNHWITWGIFRQTQVVVMWAVGFEI
jgi:hypothetical protein